MPFSLPGNGARGEQHEIALIERNVGMLEVRDPRHRRALFALAAGAQQHDLFTLEVFELLLVGPCEILRQIARLDCNLDHAVQRPPRHDEPPTRPARRLVTSLDPRHVGRERRHHHAERRLGDDLGNAFGNVGFAGAFTFAHGVGAVAHQCQHALIAYRRQTRRIGRCPDVRRRIELPVRRMINRAVRRPQDQPACLRNRMRDAHEFDVERPGREAAVEWNNLHGHVAPTAVIGHLRFQHAGRERRHIDRTLQPRPQFQHRTNMVLVRMRDDETGDLLLLRLQEAHVRQDHVHARIVLAFGKRDPEIDDQPLAIFGRTDAVEIDIHAHFAEAAERGEHKFALAALDLGFTVLRHPRVSPRR